MIAKAGEKAAVILGLSIYCIFLLATLVSNLCYRITLRSYTLILTGSGTFLLAYASGMVASANAVYLLQIHTSKNPISLGQFLGPFCGVYDAFEVNRAK